MRKNFNNQEIIKILRSVAASYQIKKVDPFRVVAYQRAADQIEQLDIKVKDLWKTDKLGDIPGIGASIASHLDELFRTGEVRHFKEVRKGLPDAMFELMSIPGIGAKSAYKLACDLKIRYPKKAIEELEKAGLNGKIRIIEGFGEESEKDILRSIVEFKSRSGRLLLTRATEVAEEVLDWLRASKEISRAEPLGSLRRQASTIGDIDIAAASDNPAEAIKHFIRYPKKERIIEAGATTASILLRSGEHVDLMVQPLKSFGALLQHFTGSKQHNIHLREFALKKGLSLSEYGIANAKALNTKKNAKKIKEFATEEEFYQTLGLDWIPPELREDTGEIELSHEGHLPHLVEISDIKGDLHVHSDFKIETSHDEGDNTVIEILMKGRELGYEYVGFTEHNPSASRHKGVEILEILTRKHAYIEQVNYSHEKSQIDRVKKLPIALNGLEIDIRPNGDLAIPERGLEHLDFAIASIHSSFRISREEMTKRLLAAMEHPKVKIIGHPTGRKLGQREGYDLDWDKIFDFCLKHHKWLEINSWPERLDLPETLVREAVKMGVKMVINTDSHASEHMGLMRYGVSVARRGWAEKEDIMNTLEYNQFIGRLRY